MQVKDAVEVALVSFFVKNEKCMVKTSSLLSIVAKLCKKDEDMSWLEDQDFVFSADKTYILGLEQRDAQMIITFVSQNNFEAARQLYLKQHSNSTSKLHECCMHIGELQEQIAQTQNELGNLTYDCLEADRVRFLELRIRDKRIQNAKRAAKRKDRESSTS